MGLIGILVAGGLMILGMGYFLLGSGGSSNISIENTSIKQENTSEEISPEGGISQYETVKDQAMDVKNRVESRVAETMKELDEPVAPKETEKKESSTVKILQKKADFGYGVPEKKRSIDTIVLHSSYNPDGNDPYSVEKVFGIWKSYGVAPHYMIDRKGNIYRLVDDANIAYHAGVSQMSDGRTNVNDFSIGIEMLNTKEDDYTDAQYKAVSELITSLKEKYSIKNVVGHDDIAPGRKTDPWNFDWKRVK